MRKRARPQLLDCICRRECREGRAGRCGGCGQPGRDQNTARSHACAPPELEQHGVSPSEWEGMPCGPCPREQHEAQQRLTSRLLLWQPALDPQTTNSQSASFLNSACSSNCPSRASRVRLAMWENTLTTGAEGRTKNTPASSAGFGDAGGDHSFEVRRGLFLARKVKWLQCMGGQLTACAG